MPIRVTRATSLPICHQRKLQGLTVPTGAQVAAEGEALDGDGRHAAAAGRPAGPGAHGACDGVAPEGDVRHGRSGMAGVPAVGGARMQAGAPGRRPRRHQHLLTKERNFARLP